MNAVVEKVTRKVTMEDGTIIDFGVRDQMKSGIDVDSNELQFLLSSGHIVNYSPFSSQHFVGVNAENLPEAIRIRLLYADLQKIKGNVASLKAVETVPVTTKVVEEVDGEMKEVEKETGETTTIYPLFEGIKTQIALLDSGKFSVRGISSDEEYVLTDEQKAYALTFINAPDEFSTPQNSEGIVWSKETLDNPEVIADIQEAWSKKDRKTRAAYRKNGSFIMNLAIVKSESKSTSVRLD